MGFFSNLFHHDDGDIKKYIGIEGMVCENCSDHVKKSLEAVPGVKKADVSLMDNEAKVVLTQPVEDETLLKAVVNAGYAVTKISDTKLPPQ